MVGNENTTVARRWEVYLLTGNEAGPSPLSSTLASFFTCFFGHNEMKVQRRHGDMGGNESA